MPFWRSGQVLAPMRLGTYYISNPFTQQVLGSSPGMAVLAILAVLAVMAAGGRGHGARIWWVR